MRIGDVSRRRRRDPLRQYYYARYRHWRFARRWGWNKRFVAAPASALDRFLLQLLNESDDSPSSIEPPL